VVLCVSCMLLAMRLTRNMPIKSSEFLTVMCWQHWARTLKKADIWPIRYIPDRQWSRSPEEL